MTAAAQHRATRSASRARPGTTLHHQTDLLGVEESLKHPDVPCGLKTDAERAPARPPSRARNSRNSGEMERILLSAEKPSARFSS